MTTQPIYQVIPAVAPGWSHIVRTSTKKSVLGAAHSTPVAVHLCGLLNADPLPEDRPKRYEVISHTGLVMVWDDCTGRTVATFWDAHPRQAEAAQDECDRLNAGDT